MKLMRIYFSLKFSPSGFVPLVTQHLQRGGDAGIKRKNLMFYTCSQEHVLNINMNLLILEQILEKQLQMWK